MKFHGKNILLRAALTAALTMSLGLSQSVLAAEGTDTMTVNAGLTEALAVSCTTDLNFGTTSIIADNSATVLTLTTDGSVSTDNNDGVVVDVNSDAAAGVCTVTGSTAADGSAFTVGFSGQDDLAGDDNGTAPTTVVSGLTLGVFSTANKTISSGGATINIGGELNIPAGLDRANFGDYTETVTVEVND